MDADKQAKIAVHAQALAALLYEETERTAHVGQLNCPTVSSPEQVKTLAGIEEAVRGHLLEHVNPEIASFLSEQVAAPKSVERDASTASWER